MVRLKSAGFAYIKAQGIIIFLIAVVMSIGLVLMKNSYAILLGAGIAIFDAFPVMGSGIILVPWALIEIARGNFLAPLSCSLFLSLLHFCGKYWNRDYWGRNWV